jgi:hypothetical protein
MMPRRVGNFPFSLKKSREYKMAYF